MGHHKCDCTSVSPRVLENLAKIGLYQARPSIQQSNISRKKRAHKRIDMKVFAAAKTRARPKHGES